MFSSLHWKYILSSEQCYPPFEQPAPDDQKYHERSTLDNIVWQEIHTGNFFKSVPIKKCMNELTLRLLECGKCIPLRWLNTVLALCEYMSFAKSWQEKGCSSQAETWQVKNILMKDFD